MPVPHLRVPALAYAPLRGDRTAARRYGLAVLSTALAFYAVLAVNAVLHIRILLLLVLPVVISAWYGGRGPGVLASLLALVDIVILFAQGTAGMAAPQGVPEAVYLATFLFVAVVVGEATESLREARAQAVMRAERLEELNVEVEQQMEEVQMLSTHLQETNDSLAEALATSEDLASRAMRLQEATAAIATAQTEAQVAGAVLGKGLPAVEAARGFLARVDDGRVEILHTSGYSPEVEARMRGGKVVLPAVERAVQTGEPVWVRSQREHLEHYRQMYEQLGIDAAPHCSAAIPLRDGDETVGALGLVFLDPQASNAATEAFSLMLGQASADALSRARGYDAERAARERAEMLAEARADVLGVVAHDLRNPLHLISSSTGLMLEVDELPPAQRRKLLTITQRATRQMNRLISDLLDATRLQAGRLRLDLGQVDARVVVHEAGETLRPAADEQGVELRAEPPTDEALMHADEGRLQQVIGNLVGNALKFTGTGGRVVLSAQPNGVEVVFSVADNGPGIPSEHQSLLFDRFWQARDADRRGAGLGLAICRGIVQAHGGRIWVESVVGLGSTFSFAIPKYVD